MKCKRVLHQGLRHSIPESLHNWLVVRTVWFGRSNRQEWDWCLCIIDLPTTLSRVGFRWTHKQAPELFIIKS